MLCCIVSQSHVVNHFASRRDFYIFKVAATEELQIFMQRHGFDTYALAVLHLYQPDSILKKGQDSDMNV